MTRLTELEPFVEKRVVEISATPLVRERLLELGLAPGRLLMVLRELPFSGPVIVQVGALFLALRFEEAEHVWVE